MFSAKTMVDENRIPFFLLHVTGYSCWLGIVATLSWTANREYGSFVVVFIPVSQHFRRLGRCIQKSTKQPLADVIISYKSIDVTKILKSNSPQFLDRASDPSGVLIFFVRSERYEPGRR